jgi:hypothetical protein
MLDEMMLKMQNKRDKLFVLLFLYNKNMNMNRPRTDNEVAVYGITFKDWLEFVVFMQLMNHTQLTLIDFF